MASDGPEAWMMCGQKIGRMIPISFGNILLPSAAFFVCFPVSQCAWSLRWDSTLHDGKIPSIFLCVLFSTDNSMMDAISYYAAELCYTMLVPFYVKRKGFRQRALKFFLSSSSFWSHVCPFCEALASLDERRRTENWFLIFSGMKWRKKSLDMYDCRRRQW